MNLYTMDTIFVGLEESFCVEISADKMTAFQNITGDINPLHCDNEFAIQEGFKSTVCYGLLTTSFLSTLAGVYLPGKYSLIRSVEVKMAKPVFIGDILSIKGTITDINKDFGFFDMKVSIFNQSGEKVLRGKMQIGFLTDKEECK